MNSTKILVSESAVRQLLKEAIDAAQLTGPVVSVSNVVDPIGPQTDPIGRHGTVRSDMELRSAVSAALDRVPEEKLNDVYEKVIKTIEKELKEEHMTNKSKMENLIRGAVRRALTEAMDDESGMIEAPPPPPAALTRTRGRASVNQVVEDLLPDEVVKAYADAYMETYEQLMDAMGDAVDDESGKVSPDTLFKFVTETKLFAQNFGEQPLKVKGETKNLPWRLFSLGLGNNIKTFLTDEKNVMGNVDLSKLASEFGVSVSGVANIQNTALAKMALSARAQDLGYPLSTD